MHLPALGPLLLAFLTCGACSERSGQPGADALGAEAGTADGEGLKLDAGGEGFSYHGRVFLGEGLEPRSSSRSWVETRVGFATVYYEESFSPSKTEGACRFGQLLPAPPAVTTWMDGGPVTVTGGQQPLSFSFNPNDYYRSTLGAGTQGLFQHGRPLTVVGKGSSQLPGFGASIRAPAELEVESPDLRQRASVASTAEDYSVRWTPAAADRVRVVLRCGDLKGEHRLECDSYDDGLLVLPALLLKALAPSCSAAKAAQIDIVRLNERHVEQGDLRVTLRAWTLLRGSLSLAP